MLNSTEIKKKIWIIIKFILIITLYVGVGKCSMEIARNNRTEIVKIGSLALVGKITFVNGKREFFHLKKDSGEEVTITTNYVIQHFELHKMQNENIKVCASVNVVKNQQIKHPDKYTINYNLRKISTDIDDCKMDNEK